MIKRFQLLATRSDLAIAVFLLLVILMMILPLPTFMVDLMIASNMGVAVLLLMLAVYLSSPLEFLGFPSVLLLTTLSRLALAITTTRLILLNADAGKMVYAFGNFVVGGNLIVGGVIFLIITIVQFIVITKGSERVAEVSARFSLDALPGKQMSIDGDMRAGLINMEQAKKRRVDLEKESQLYGAMDGAMKFVKGDAIAGLIIIVVNILGGVLIGVFQKGLSLRDALHTYSLLTIGDGLVTQIPALFISITAGILVTRVSNEDSQDLGKDIVSQMSAKPGAIMVAGVILGGLSLVPGFPSMTFLFLGVATFGTGFYLFKQARMQEEQEKAGPSFAGQKARPGKKPGTHAPSQGYDMTYPIMIELSHEVGGALDLGELQIQLKELNLRLYQELGVVFPNIHLNLSDALQRHNYSVMINEIPIHQGTVRTGCLLVRDNVEHLDILNIPYESADGIPLSGRRMAWVKKSESEILAKAGITGMDVNQFICYVLSVLLKKHAEEFLGIQEARNLLQKMERDYPELVKEVQRIMPIQKTAEILQRLVSENISIRNMRNIVESLVEWGQKEKDVVQLTEYVRSGQKRYITHKYSQGLGLLPAYLLDEDLEEAIRNGIRMTSAGAYLALDPSVSHQFLVNLKSAVGNLDDIRHMPVLITSMDIRRYVRKLIEGEFYQLPVLSFQELMHDVTIQPLSRISMGG
ncbi:MAG: type III secretion system export apparatus subunit SctV [Oligoflexales bacterium]|nr:type III secretion system export apparatus subunit SctV [Oligoflexales bacterium]